MFENNSFCSAELGEIKNLGKTVRNALNDEIPDYFLKTMSDENKEIG